MSTVQSTSKSKEKEQIDAVPEKQKTASNTSSQERIKLPAEIKFDRWAYGGISYGAQALSGIFLSRSIKHGWLNKPFRQLSEWITKKPAKEPSTTLVITVMIMVGNLFLIPLKWVENRKPQIVRWLQERTNAKQPPTQKERAFQEEQLTKLEHESRQSTWSLILGRAFGLGVVYGANHLIGEKNNIWLQDTSAHYIKKGFGAIGLKKIEQSEVLGQYLKIGFVDSFYSMVSAGGLYVYSHMIHPLFSPHKKHKAPATSITAGETALDVAASTVPTAIEHSVETQTSRDAPEKPTRKVITPSKESFATQHPSKTEAGWQTGTAKTETENPPQLQAI